MYCSKQFETKRKDTEYCSSSCSNTACKTHDNVELNCKHCKKQFTVKYIHRDKLFCSRSCATIYQNNIMTSYILYKNQIKKTDVGKGNSEYLVEQIISEYAVRLTTKKNSTVSLSEFNSNLQLCRAVKKSDSLF